MNDTPFEMDDDGSVGHDTCDTLGHDTRTTYEDEDGIQWECVVCGAEGWDDSDD